MLKVLILFFFLWLPFYTVCQSFSETLSSSLEQNDIMKALPPVQTLIDSAVIYSPLLKISDADLVIRNLRIKSEKRELLRNIGIESGVRYGVFDNLILTEDFGIEELQTPPTLQTRYNIGVYLKIPLSAIIDRSNVSIAREELDQTRYQRDNTIRELRQLIIIQYYDVIKIHKGLIVKNETVETYRIQLFRAEEDFINGTINVAEYSRLKNMFSQAVLDFEESKVDFNLALLLLEEMVGTKIELNTSEW